MNISIHNDERVDEPPSGVCACCAWHWVCCIIIIVCCGLCVVCRVLCVVCVGCVVCVY